MSSKKSRSLKKPLVIIGILILMLVSYGLGTTRSREQVSTQSEDAPTTQEVISPDKKRKLLIRKETFSPADSQSTKYHILVSDADGKNEKDVLAVYNLNSISFRNWSDNSKYFFIQFTKYEGDNIFIFKGDGEVFEDGKPYIDALDIGLPQNHRIEDAVFHLQIGGGFYSLHTPINEPVLMIHAVPTASYKYFYIYPTLSKTSLDILESK